ncbi:MAG: hypothetical protein JXC32_14425 [Anaerolineae bacterium]|nr:hypothetical protein [Anaerolineae bacterium]
MTEAPKTEQAWHRTFAAKCFNLTWDLLDKAERTREEEDRMVHAAHASRYHWGEIGTPLEFERGEWQICRVYAVLGRAELALFHARRCLEICEANGIGDFDIAFAHEALARAYAVAGDREASTSHVAIATQAADQISGPDDRTYFLSELATVSDMLRSPS